MITENQLTAGERLGRIETDLQLIKSMLKELLTSKVNGAAAVEEQIMGVNEAVAFLGIQKHILYAKCGSGDIPSFRVGKLYKFKRSELIQWMEAQGIQRQTDTEAFVNGYLQKNMLRG